MGTSRLEAFSDGVIAIIITIMVLELKKPEGPTFDALKAIFPSLLSYIISFIMVGIYWNNHHHLFHIVKKVSAGVMWANLSFLFWLSLIPFITNWVGENSFKPYPVALYAALFAVCGVSFTILETVIQSSHKNDENLKLILKRQQKKGIISFIAYLTAIPLAYINTYISTILFILVAAIWILPDKKIERSYN